MRSPGIGRSLGPSPCGSHQDSGPLHEDFVKIAATTSGMYNATFLSGAIAELCATAVVTARVRISGRERSTRGRLQLADLPAAKRVSGADQHRYGDAPPPSGPNENQVLDTAIFVKILRPLLDVLAARNQIAAAPSARDRIEPGRWRVVCPERVSHLPDRLIHAPRGARIAQRAVDSVGEEPSGKDDAPRVHGSTLLESLSETEKRLASGSHRLAIDHDRGEGRTSLGAIGVCHDPTKVAREAPPCAAVDQLAGPQRQSRGRLTRATGHELTVEPRARDVHAQPERRAGSR
jgi:hypothetical protein